MFRQPEKANRSERIMGAIPVLSEMQAMARVPARVWGLAKVALIVWIALTVISTIARVATVFLPLRVNREDTAEASAPRPIYAIWNFNFINNAQKPGETKAGGEPAAER